MSHKKIREQLKCNGCGQNFSRRRRNNNDANKYCSRHCAYNHADLWRGKHLSWSTEDAICVVRQRLQGWSCFICPVTGQKVKRRGGVSDEGKEIRRKERIVGWAESTCRTCSSIFLRQGVRGKGECASCVKRKARKKARRHKQSTHRKRARLFGVPHEPFKKEVIFIRDQYRCRLCGIKCKTRSDIDGYYHSEMATLDHIIPMSAGGGHVKGNCWTLCMSCNIEKSNTGPIAWSDKDGQIEPLVWPHHIETLKSRAYSYLLDCNKHVLHKNTIGVPPKGGKII